MSRIKFIHVIFFREIRHKTKVLKELDTIIQQEAESEQIKLTNTMDFDFLLFGEF